MYLCVSGHVFVC